MSLRSIRVHLADEPTAGAASQFATTLWSVVLTAGHLSSPGAQAALEQLCRGYWHPLYAFLRRSGYQEADAQAGVTRATADRAK